MGQDFFHGFNSLSLMSDWWLINFALAKLFEQKLESPATGAPPAYLSFTLRLSCNCNTDNQKRFPKNQG
jgi:hypothetical protein